MWWYNAEMVCRGWLYSLGLATCNLSFRKKIVFGNKYCYVIWPNLFENKHGITFTLTSDTKETWLIIYKVIFFSLSKCASVKYKWLIFKSMHLLVFIGGPLFLSRYKVLFSFQCHFSRCSWRDQVSGAWSSSSKKRNYEVRDITRRIFCHKHIYKAICNKDWVSYPYCITDKEYSTEDKFFYTFLKVMHSLFIKKKELLTRRSIIYW